MPPPLLPWSMWTKETPSLSDDVWDSFESETEGGCVSYKELHFIYIYIIYVRN